MCHIWPKLRYDILHMTIINISKRDVKRSVRISGLNPDIYKYPQYLSRKNARPKMSSNIDFFGPPYSVLPPLNLYWQPCYSMFVLSTTVCLSHHYGMFVPPLQYVCPPTTVCLSRNYSMFTPLAHKLHFVFVPPKCDWQTDWWTDRIQLYIYKYLDMLKHLLEPIKSVYKCTWCINVLGV